MPYVTAEEIRDEAQSNMVSSVALDGLYGKVADAVSEAIDEHCFRTFVEAGDTATARTFHPTRCLTMVDELDDIAAATGLELAVDTGDTGEYVALDASAWFAEVDNRSGMVTAIRSTSTFPYSTVGRRTLEVTARWGWPSTPEPVKRAAMIWAVRLVNRRSTPTGIQGFGEFGGVRLTTIDPDVKSLLAPYRLRSRLLR